MKVFHPFAKQQKKKYFFLDGWKNFNNLQVVVLKFVSLQLFPVAFSLFFLLQQQLFC
jgi:hypothetical protein